MEETSLTDFLDDGEEATDDGVEASDDGEEASDDGVEASDDGAADTTGDDFAPELVDDEAPPATTTAAWSPGSVACPACGEPAGWRYRDGDALVCPECLSWE